MKDLIISKEKDPNMSKEKDPNMLKEKDPNMSKEKDGSQLVSSGYQRLRLARTLAMDVSWICMGMFSEVTGPTLPALKARNDVNYEEISRALVARSVGFLTGSLAGGLLCEKFNRMIDLWVALSLFLAAAAVTATPWCRTLELLGFFMCCDGFSKGILAAGGNSFIIQLWGDKAAVPNHSLHFCFGIGALLAPQIVRPFLLGHANSDDVANLTRDGTTNETLDFHLSQPIEVPYGIIGAFTFIIGLVFLWFHMFTTHEFAHTKSLKELFNVFSCISGNKILSCLVFVLLMVCFSLPIGAERAYGKFIFSYATEMKELGISPADGTILETVFWVFFTTGRGLSTLAARWTPPAILMAVEVALNVIAAVILVIWARHNPTMLWVGSALIGVAMAPLFPACLAWINLHMEVTAMTTAFAFVSTALAAMLFSWIAGYLFEYRGPPSLMWVMLGYALMAVVLYSILYITVTYKEYRENKHSKKSAQVMDEPNTNEEGNGGKLNFRF